MDEINVGLTVPETHRSLILNVVQLSVLCLEFCSGRFILGGSRIDLLGIQTNASSATSPTPSRSVRRLTVFSHAPVILLTPTSRRTDVLVHTRLAGFRLLRRGSLSDQHFLVYRLCRKFRLFSGFSCPATADCHGQTWPNKSPDVPKTLRRTGRAPRARPKNIAALPAAQRQGILRPSPAALKPRSNDYPLPHLSIPGDVLCTAPPHVPHQKRASGSLPLIEEEGLDEVVASLPLLRRVRWRQRVVIPVHLLLQRVHVGIVVFSNRNPHMRQIRSLGHPVHVPACILLHRKNVRHLSRSSQLLGCGADIPHKIFHLLKVFCLSTSTINSSRRREVMALTGPRRTWSFHLNARPSTDSLVSQLDSAAVLDSTTHCTTAHCCMGFQLMLALALSALTIFLHASAIRFPDSSDAHQSDAWHFCPGDW